MVYNKNDIDGGRNLQITNSLEMIEIKWIVEKKALPIFCRQKKLGLTLFPRH